MMGITSVIVGPKKIRVIPVARFLLQIPVTGSCYLLPVPAACFATFLLADVLLSKYICFNYSSIIHVVGEQPCAGSFLTTKPTQQCQPRVVVLWSEAH